MRIQRDLRLKPLLNKRVVMQGDAIVCLFTNDPVQRLRSFINAQYLSVSVNRPVYTCGEESGFFESPLTHLSEVPVPVTPRYNTAPGILSWLTLNPGPVLIDHRDIEVDIPIEDIRVILKNLTWSVSIREQVSAYTQLSERVAGVYLSSKGYQSTLLQQHLAYIKDQEETLFVISDDASLVPDRLISAQATVEEEIVDQLLLVATNFRYSTAPGRFSWIVQTLRPGTYRSTNIPRLVIHSLPSRFDREAYRSLNPDLSVFDQNPVALEQHYLEWGFYEQRAIQRDPKMRILIYSVYPGFNDYIVPLLSTLTDRGYNAVVLSHIQTNPYTLPILFGMNGSQVPLPEGKFIIVQLEQWTSNWMTPQYISRLQRAHEVWDFDLSNIPRLWDLQVNAKYVPLGRPSVPVVPTVEVTEDIDILFFGTMNLHRKTVLQRLIAEGFKVHVETSVYGSRRDDLIRHSRLVVNIHFYQGAATEQLRIIPCLALGKLVISEPSEPHLPIAEFAASVEELILCCKKWLACSSTERQARAAELYAQVPLFSEIIPWESLTLNS